MLFHKRRNTFLYRKMQYSSDSSSLSSFRVHRASAVLFHTEKKKTDNYIHFKPYIHIVFENAPDRRWRRSLQK